MNSVLIQKQGIFKVVLVSILLLFSVVLFAFQPTSASAHHSNSFSSFPTIQSGSSGNYVKFAQAVLYVDNHGISSIDGSFGPNTKSSVISFQKKKGLTADGIVGANTWNAMRSSFSLSGNTLTKSSSLDALYLDRTTDNWQLKSTETGSGGFLISSGQVR